MSSFEAPGLLSGVLGTLFTALLARKQLGLSQEVPCVLARRLRELEGGAAAVAEAGCAPAATDRGVGDHGMGSEDAGTAPGSGQLLQGSEGQEALLPAGRLDPAEDASAGASAGKLAHMGAKQVIQLTATTTGRAALGEESEQHMRQQPGRSSAGTAAATAAAGGPRRSSDARTAAAHGLLAALSAASPEADSGRAERRSSSAQASLESSSAEDLAEAEGGWQGEGGLLPARMVRSHHDMSRAAYSPLHRSPLPTRTAPSQHVQVGQSTGPSALESAGSPGAARTGTDGAGTAAYLSDPRQLVARLAPWACMLVVVAGTRVPYLQRSNGHELQLHLRSLGDLKISSNLVISFHDLCRWGVRGAACTWQPAHRRAPAVRGPSPVCRLPWSLWVVLSSPVGGFPFCHSFSPPLTSPSQLPCRININWSYALL